MGPFQDPKGVSNWWQGQELRFILWFSVFTGPAACGVLKKLVGALGGSVNFPLNLSADPIDSIIWVFNTTTLVTIQPTLADKKALIIVTQHRNKERVNFPHEGYSLKLSKLKKNDSGVYRVEIHSSTLQDPLTQEYELRVYGEQNQFQRWTTAFLKW